ncbi:MAG TPA: XTP/dITP diphosphatase [Candidatus Desulfofervidus auxilii]|uniref:dITP/XTP pyrophosphatase n=1 Tax=Desulfofervidus auxilii TaxID=1621989 RepID=A0A7V0IAF3_DESA2|nr:XTP/dITP diphosphatase [Candidatus Desulfofervidus auxilii]
MKLVLATRNKGKIKEIKALMADIPIEILSLSDFKNIPNIPETGKTFLENALNKAKTVASLTGHFALADDSGLCVDYLNGAPGIHSARFAGDNATDEENNKKLLTLLKDVPWEKRNAAFICVIVLCSPEGKYYSCEGRCEGIIAFEPKGKHGFGYDPIFFLPVYKKTMAQIPLEIKNRISHRAKALKKMKEIIKNILKEEKNGEIGC